MKLTYLLGKLRHVVTSVAFTGDVELVGLSLGKTLEELQHEPVVVDGGLVVTGCVICLVFRVGKPHTGGLLDEEDVGDLVPAELIHVEVALLVGEERPVLSKQSHNSAAARTAVRPQDHRVVLGGLFGLKIPIKDFLPVRLVINRKVARVVLEGSFLLLTREEVLQRQYLMVRGVWSM